MSGRLPGPSWWGGIAARWAPLAACALAVGCGGGPASGGVAAGPLPAPGRAGTALEVHGAFDYGWSVRQPDGAERSLAAHRGRVVVLNLWASWCPPCVAELASLEGLARAVADLEVDVLPVSPEDPDGTELSLEPDYDGACFVVGGCETESASSALRTEREA